jgi:hypothetical protein
MDVAGIPIEPCKETLHGNQTRKQNPATWSNSRSRAGGTLTRKGLDEPIASFEERADALEYALRLADMKMNAQVRVRH